MEPLFSPDIHVLYEHMMLPLAIYYVENGMCRAYLVSDGLCKMYGSTREELMSRLNGDDPFGDIPEKDKMEEVVKGFSEKDEPYNVVFHARAGKERRLITVHAVGIHEYTRDGRRYSIVHYDEISDSSRRFLFKDEEREMKERENLLYEIDDAIARSYTSVIYMDTSDRSFHVVRLNRHGRMIEEELKKATTPRELMQTYVNALVYRDDAEAVMQYGDIDHVMELLKKTNPIYHVYRTIRDGRMVYYRLKIIPLDDGRKLVYGFEHFDEQIREQIARKSEHEMQMTLLAGLSCEYEAVWLVDAAIHHTRLIRHNDNENIFIRENEGNYDAIIGEYIDTYVVPEDRERVYQQTSIDNLIRNTREDKIYHINYARMNSSGEKNYFQQSVARVTDESGVLHFVCGLRNIDQIIEEEKNKNLLFSMAHVDNMTGLNNRRSFDEYMDENMSKVPDDDTVFFSFDLNELKAANDQKGHEAGDELIKGVAECMKKTVGQYGQMFRTGGDEFTAVIKVDPEKTEEVIETLKNSFDGWKGKLFPVLSVAMGYVCASERSGMTLNEMKLEAEKRMYAHKADHYSLEGNDRRKGRK